MSLLGLFRVLFLKWSNHLDLIVGRADAVISLVMCLSISWNMVVPQTTRHRVLFLKWSNHLDLIVGRADAVISLVMC